jgi:hypothetical protein
MGTGREYVVSSQAGRWAIWITGSRSWSDADSIRAVLGRFPAGSLVLHGDDLGADRLADVVARGLQMPTAKVPYIEWMGPTGGGARNKLIGELLAGLKTQGWSTLVLAFGEGRGGEDGAKIAKDLGLTVRAFREPKDGTG